MNRRAHHLAIEAKRADFIHAEPAMPSEQELLEADVAYLANQKQRDQQRLGETVQKELEALRRSGVL